MNGELDAPASIASIKLSLDSTLTMVFRLLIDKEWSMPNCLNLILTTGSAFLVAEL
jgi:hypothetical protein